jgi:hypothetical protein
VKHRRKKTLGLCAIFKGVSAAIIAYRWAEVSQSLGTERHNEKIATDENLWKEVWPNLNGILSTVKQFKQQVDKYL